VELEVISGEPDAIEEVVHMHDDRAEPDLQTTRTEREYLQTKELLSLSRQMTS